MALQQIDRQRMVPDAPVSEKSADEYSTNGVLRPIPVVRPAGHRRSGPVPQRIEPFSLSSLLACNGCDRPLRPSREIGGRRVYLFLCGCRRLVVDADVVERLALDRVEAESSYLVAGVRTDELGETFRALFVEVRVGADVEDLAYRWRI